MARFCLRRQYHNLVITCTEKGPRVQIIHKFTRMDSPAKFTLLISLLFAFLSTSGQPGRDTLLIIKSGGAYTFSLGEKQLDFVDLPNIMKAYPAAYKKIKVAKTNRTFSNVFLGLGCISLAYGVLSGVSYAVEDKDAAWLASGTVAGLLVGGAYIGISFPLRKAYRKKTRMAVDIYNRELQAAGLRPE